MKVLGSGLLAQQILAVSNDRSDALIFARGVSDSSCEDMHQYDRECSLLYAAINECLESGRRLVYFSSAGAVYGDFHTTMQEDSPLFPTTIYGRHKVLCESIIRHSGIKYLILRLPNVVGKGGNEKQLLPFLVSSVQSGKARLQKNATRDLIGVDDAVGILMDLLDSVEENTTVNVASGHSVPVSDILYEIEQSLGKMAEIELIEGGQAQRFSTTRLHKLLPALNSFDPNYYKDLIAKYL